MGNPVNWFEVPVTDMERAKKFYTEVFGFVFEDMGEGPVELSVIQGDMNSYGATGALAKGEVYVPSQNGSVVYFECNDLENELGKIEEAGGKALTPKTSIGENGFIAHAIDSEGNRIALHSMK